MHGQISLKHFQAYYVVLKLGNTLSCMLQLPLSYNARTTEVLVLQSGYFTILSTNPDIQMLRKVEEKLTNVISSQLSAQGISNDVRSPTPWLFLKHLDSSSKATLAQFLHFYTTLYQPRVMVVIKHICLNSVLALPDLVTAAPGLGEEEEEQCL